MLKPTASFRMPKAVKISLATSRFSSKEQRSSWKKAMIGAVLASQVKIKDKKKPEITPGE